ncbi:HAD-IIB family hydrolase [Nanoarchaeota archaeon]
MLIIFTDLDGTLLNENYSFKEARPALKLLKKKRVPLIFCTSKTRAEVQVYQKRMKLKEPFIVENGGAIFIPKNYFDFKFKYDKIVDSFFVIELGARYKKLIKALRIVEKKTDSKIIGFNQMSAKELAKDCGLSLKEAKLAKKREYVEPFKIIKGSINKISKEINKQGFNYTRSARYHYIVHDNDKGRAINALINLFKKKYGKATSVGIGDNFNDIPMFKSVDKSFLVKTYNGKYDKSLKNLKNIKKINGTGPAGWNKAIKSLV